ncbi:AAA ATPase [Methylobacterium sp. 4-46]|uniref:ATP-binding protein n=1 Tax=unclassified Methylobacterium TaxID=2615210 RepID=UPI000152D916|nr:MULTISPECIES: ATP-binding protein [Methylobacterium]ACA20513.1 AAA ATPase [Methylobacterium sp. 4-46]WFT79678.1 ATP-binding protein [Methylobacterium nodulans]
MTISVEMGVAAGHQAAALDLEELLATRLLVQGNSGSGKSHLLRRLLEQSAAHVQQVVIDPEGDFVTLADRFGHVVVDGAHGEADLQRIAARVRAHRVSVVLTLESLDVEAQMRAAAAFLGGLFDAERDHWYPVLVVVDEAQLFAPAAAGEVSDEARKASLGAMTNLMCRGRKRGLAGVIATQRLAKLAKNVAAEASNFLMGRTFLDIDMARAADLLGLERRQAESFRDLERGSFVALGPALSKRPLTLRIGPVATAPRSTSPKLVPLPAPAAEDLRDLILTPAADEPPRMPAPRPAAPRPSPVDLLQQLAQARPLPPEPEEQPALGPEEREAALAAILREIAADPDAGHHTVAVLYQDFLVRCRMRRVGAPLDLPAFRRRLAVARAGLEEGGREAEADAVLDACAGLPEEVQGLFLLLARAARAGAPCPSDEALARAIGSRSPGRARRLLAFVESRGAVVCRTDFRGNRIVAIPGLGCETGPGDPKAAPGDPKAAPSDPKAAPGGPKGAAEPPAGLFAAE